MTLLTGVLLAADTTANRPAATDVPSGTLFPSTDDDIIYQSNGSTWNTWATLTGGGGGAVATDTIWDAKGDLAAGTGSDTASKLTVGSNGKLLVAASGQATGLLWDSGYLGGLELVYKYTVAGADKASIDTGVDTADAGTNDWTNGDVLEVFMTTRTDDAGAGATLLVTFNNDAATNYERQIMNASNTTVAASVNNATNQVAVDTHGSGGSASTPGTANIVIPNYAGTTFHKSMTVASARPDGTAANQNVQSYAAKWNNTAAITRMKVAGNGAAKLKVGSQVLIYKRRNA